MFEEGELLTTFLDNSKMWVYFNVIEVEYFDYMMEHKGEVLVWMWVFLF